MTGDDLRALRKKHKLTQEQLGKMIGVHKRTIINYEKSGEIPESQVKLIHLSFNAIDELEGLGLRKKEDYVNEHYVNEHYVNEPLTYIKNKNGLTYEELPNGKFLVEVPKVPYNAYASFIEVYGDEYQVKESFETSIFTVDHPGKGKYISFTVRNDSMNGGGINDTPSGAEVLGRELQRHHWKDGFRESQYGWIIISHDGMFHKDIEGPNSDGMVICKSRNKSPEFPEFEMNLNNVHTIWKVIKRTF